ncbi:LysR substrate-binding domain-containing protein [Methylobacterium brachythecii]|uniref:LysR family hydrogen peroxide-inducible transcriptional activator n=1 Tax=Methylobacterium brachythecii TaxID=1176177 RepID=A0A7W6AE80_9HYPH|nr:LysR substrate-binding domain-containing protein [Methylobacterium brachythecii]MBB3901063.1 LysR family hydrogen peroxide-inducible transcriptional activator [Methylobacterium brachythecii]GLS46641.1 LysR family transcriptional regulator [Methylobacterium brachythecii]
MTLQDLRYLVALVDHGHFGRAAEACHVSQPTLSTQIKKLEAQLGVTLFERTNRSVRVTAYGEEVVARARQILTDVEAIASVGRRVAGPLVGTFSLGVIPTLGPYLLPWLVPALNGDYPELRLAVHEDLTASLIERLLSHRLDAALVALPVEDARLETLPLFDEPFWFAEPKGGEALAEVLTRDDLRGRRLLLLTEGHCMRDQVLSLCRTPDREADEDFRATSLETIRQMVATGMGSTLLPAMAVEEFRNRGVTVRPLDAGLGRRIGLVWRRSYPRSRDLQLVARTLCEHLPAAVLRLPAEPLS